MNAVSESLCEQLILYYQNNLEQDITAVCYFLSCNLIKVLLSCFTSILAHNKTSAQLSTFVLSLMSLCYPRLRDKKFNTQRSQGY